MANSSGAPLNEESVVALRAVVKEHGLDGAARRLNVSANTVARGLALVNIARASRLLIEQGLGKAAA